MDKRPFSPFLALIDLIPTACGHLAFYLASLIAIAEDSLQDSQVFGAIIRPAEMLGLFPFCLIGLTSTIVDFHLDTHILLVVCP